MGTLHRPGTVAFHDGDRTTVSVPRIAAFHPADDVFATAALGGSDSSTAAMRTRRKFMTYLPRRSASGSRHCHAANVATRRYRYVRFVLLIRKPRRDGLRHVTPVLAEVQVKTPRFHVFP